MIVGIGIDVVDLARFERALLKAPGLRERLFTETEREQTGASLAARFAAKEALLKALGGFREFRWHEIEVISRKGHRPTLALHGAVAEKAARVGAGHTHLSLSHDAGVAMAFVIAESEGSPSDSASPDAPGPGLSAADVTRGLG